jgi:hypothetical protein
MLEGDKLRDFLKSSEADKGFTHDSLTTPSTLCALCGLELEPDHPHLAGMTDGEVTVLLCVHHFCAMLLALGSGGGMSI